MSTVSSSSNRMESSTKRNLFVRIPGSIKAWACLVGYLVVVKYILASLPPLNVKVVTSDFAWSTIVLFGMIGSVGILLSMVTGFPDALDKAISNRQRFVIPVLAGAGLGILAILIDQITQGTKFIEMQSGETSFNVYFPASLFVYTGGIVLVEAMFRLFAIPFFLWLISNLILRGGGQDRTFWI